jgi:hypothetical protein
MEFTSTSTTILIKGYIVDGVGNPLSGVEIDITSPNILTKLTSNNNGEWSISFPTTDFDPKTISLIFTKDDYELKNITNLSKTGEEEGTEIYDISRITLLPILNIENKANSIIFKEVVSQEALDIAQLSKSQLDAAGKILANINTKKGDLKTILIPTVIKLLAPFGPLALQAILKKLPISKILSLCRCPKKSIILSLIKKRNNLAKSINNIYSIVKSLSTLLTTINAAVSIIQLGVLAIEILPYPATGIPPVLPPLTSGIIQTIGTAKDILKDLLKIAKVNINLLSMTLGAFGIVLGVILRLLSILDALVLKCAEDKNVSFNAINNELNLFVNTSTGISNSRIIAELNESSTVNLEFISLEPPELEAIRVFLDEQKILNNQLTEPDEIDTPIQLDTLQPIITPVESVNLPPNNTYRGFKLEIKLDEASTSKYPKRFAQALNVQGVPVLKTESSFASDPQVLLSELKFIIDSNPNLTAE